MLIYTTERFIKAHEDTHNPYKNHSYNRLVREAICCCGNLIGEQVKYTDLDEQFYFEDKNIQDYIYCPYCGRELNPQSKNAVKKRMSKGVMNEY